MLFLLFPTLLSLKEFFTNGRLRDKVFLREQVGNMVNV